MKLTFLNRRYRLIVTITLGLLAIVMGLLTVIGFRYTLTIATQVSDSSIISDAYGRAKEAVAAEESLERKYRLEPSPQVRLRYDDASSQLQTSLLKVGQLGDFADRYLCEEVLRDHAKYLQITYKMFAAVDAADIPLVLKIDADEVDPIYDSIESRVGRAAETSRNVALVNVAQYLHIESLLFTTTLFGLGIGGVLLLIFGWMFIHERRLTLTANEHERLSLHDGLTGLPNRVLFTRQAEEALATRDKGKLVAIMLLDLNRFKEVNDTFGHQAGDELLQQVTKRLSSILSPIQKLGRLGGDEFSVSLPNVDDHTEVTQVGANIVAALKDSFELSGVEVSIGISVGISFAPEHGMTLTELLRAADEAMYTAKRGQSGYSVYTTKSTSP